MEINQDEFHQNKTSEVGAVAECIEYGNEDSKFKSESPIVAVEGIDSCKFTSLVYNTPTDPLSCSASKNSNGISDDKGSERYVVTNGSGFTVPCKSASLSTISEADRSKEANGLTVENKDNEEEKSLQHDDGNFTELKITPLVKFNEDENSKCLENVEEKVSGVEDDHGNSDTAARNSLSRERKKSKYLCYPFVNLGKESKVLPFLQSEYEDSKSPGNNSVQDEDTYSLVKCGKRKREPRKSLADLVKLGAITASSAELLAQLQSVALNHLNFYFDSSFDPAELLFNRFRVSVFRGLPDSEVIDVENQNGEPVTEEKSSDLFDSTVNLSPDSQQPADSNTKPKRTRKKELTVPASEGLDNAERGPVSQLPADSNAKLKRKRRKNDAAVGLLSDATMSASECPNQPEGGPVSQLLADSNTKRRKNYATISASEGPTQTEGNPDKKKRIRKKGTKPGISYINGANAKPISLEVCLQDAGPYPMAAEGATQEKKSSTEITIDQMKQSLELMTSMLDKSGSSISTETRVSLEIEIKKLLQKVNPMANSSPT